MVQINHSLRELSLKVVYYGPALSGKTTNLAVLYERVSPGVRGRLLSVDTKDDRTLFFDMLPIHFQTGSGFKVKIKLYTVPGQVMHASTRRLVLQGADAVAFIADASRNATPSNNEAWRNMMEDMRANGIDPDSVPLVIQFNKMDLPDARSVEEIRLAEERGKEPIFPSIAVRGEGVVETLHGLLQLTFRQLQRRYGMAGMLRIDEQGFLGEIFRSMNMEGAVTRTLDERFSRTGGA